MPRILKGRRQHAWTRENSTVWSHDESARSFWLGTRPFDKPIYGAASGRLLARPWQTNEIVSIYELPPMNLFSACGTIETFSSAQVWKNMNNGNFGRPLLHPEQMVVPTYEAGSMQHKATLRFRSNEVYSSRKWPVVAWTKEHFPMYVKLYQLALKAFDEYREDILRQGNVGVSTTYWLEDGVPVDVAYRTSETTQRMLKLAAEYMKG